MERQHSVPIVAASHLRRGSSAAGGAKDIGRRLSAESINNHVRASTTTAVSTLHAANKMATMALDNSAHSKTKSRSNSVTSSVEEKDAGDDEGEAPPDPVLPEHVMLYTPVLSISIGVELDYKVSPFVVVSIREAREASVSGPKNLLVSKWREIGRTPVVQKARASVSYNVVCCRFEFGDKQDLLFEVFAESDPLLPGVGESAGSATITVSKLVSLGNKEPTILHFVKNTAVLGKLMLSCIPSVIESDEADLLRPNWLPIPEKLTIIPEKVTNSTEKAVLEAPYIPDWFELDYETFPVWYTRAGHDGSNEYDVHKMFITARFPEETLAKLIAMTSWKFNILRHVPVIELSLSVCVKGAVAQSIVDPSNKELARTSYSKLLISEKRLIFSEFILIEEFGQGKTLIVTVTERKSKKAIAGAEFMWEELVTERDDVKRLFAITEAPAKVDRTREMFTINVHSEVSTERSGKFLVSEAEARPRYNLYLRTTLLQEYESMADPKLALRYYERVRRDALATKLLENLFAGTLRILPFIYLDYSLGNGDFDPKSEDPNTFLHYGADGNPNNPYSFYMQALCDIFLDFSKQGLKVYAYGAQGALREEDEIISDKRVWAKGAFELQDGHAHVISRKGRSLMGLPEYANESEVRDEPKFTVQQDFVQQNLDLRNTLLNSPTVRTNTVPPKRHTITGATTPIRMQEISEISPRPPRRGSTPPVMHNTLDGILNANKEESNGNKKVYGDIRDEFSSPSPGRSKRNVGVNTSNSSTPTAVKSTDRGHNKRHTDIGLVTPVRKNIKNEENSRESPVLSHTATPVQGGRRQAVRDYLRSPGENDVSYGIEKLPNRPQVISPRANRKNSGTNVRRATVRAGGAGGGTVEYENEQEAENIANKEKQDRFKQNLILPLRAHVEKTPTGKVMRGLGNASVNSTVQLMELYRDSWKHLLPLAAPPPFYKLMRHAKAHADSSMYSPVFILSSCDLSEHFLRRLEVEIQEIKDLPISFVIVGIAGSQKSSTHFKRLINFQKRVKKLEDDGTVRRKSFYFSLLHTWTEFIGEVIRARADNILNGTEFDSTPNDESSELRIYKATVEGVLRQWHWPAAEISDLLHGLGDPKRPMNGEELSRLYFLLNHKVRTELMNNVMDACKEFVVDLCRDDERMAAMNSAVPKAEEGSEESTFVTMIMNFFCGFGL